MFTSMRRPASCCLYLAALVLACVDAVPAYRLCATNKTDQNRCGTVTKGDSKVECVHVTDSVDCALKLQQGLADFGVFSAEEALLASNFIDKSVQVIADIRHNERQDDPFAFQAVVVVKASSYNNTLSSLRGSNFCHLGFAPGQLWTPAVLKQFERSVVSTTCVDGLPGVEQEIKALSNFFTSACRPGPWVQQDQYDDRLKTSYNNLCQLCDSPKTCSYASHETGSHRAALTCLTHRGGDLTYVALSYVRQYFGLEKNSSPLANIKEYRFLCPDGSIQTLDSPLPCAWLQQPWSAVLARRDIAVSVQSQLLGWFSADPRQSWQQALSDLMVESDHKLHSVSQLLPNYVRQNGETKQGCSGSVKWCTSSTAETRKCEWLKAAVQTHGIQPNIECVTASSTWECWAHVRDGIASITRLDTEYGYIARQSYNLSPFAFMDAGINDHYQILAIISSGNQEIKGWPSVRQKKACFPEFGGLAWASVVATLLGERQLAKTCPYAQAVSSFFGGACAPGAKDYEHIRGSGLVPARLCSVCTTANITDSCSTSASSVFYGDLGALRCLTASGFGDIAFIDYRQLAGSEGQLAQDLDPSSYRVLCRNGSLAQNVGLNVDNDCALSTGIGSEMVARSDRSWARDVELTELLLDIDQWFGSIAPSKLDSVLHLYSEFQGVKDLLFKDDTRGVVLPNDTGFAYVNSYKKLQEVNSVCDTNRNDSTPSSLLPSLLVLVIIAISPFAL